MATKKAALPNLAAANSPRRRAHAKKVFGRVTIPGRRIGRRGRAVRLPTGIYKRLHRETRLRLGLPLYPQYDVTVARTGVGRRMPVRRRLSGPVKFVRILADHWKLREADLVPLLGFEAGDTPHVAAVLQGQEELRGRDARDRITHVFRIRETLDSLFRDLKVENDWLREPHDLLEGRSPMSLLLGGSMEDLLLVRDYVDEVAGR
ncbi:MAG: DUF2384 domain-containing protein [Holophagales bacterium]|nr:DUF2384 domain-containing protein [Holophagales bacterium]MYH23772.1 DUF2384 domain-containing protein [Holophagales bacterium]